MFTFGLLLGNKSQKKPTHTHSLKYLKNKNNIKEQKERSGGRERGSACRGKYLIKQRHVVGGRFRRHFLHMQRRLCCLLHLLPPRLFFCDCGFWFSFVCLASRLPPLLASSCQCWQTMRRAATLKVSFGAQRVASRRVANMQIAWICFCCCHVFIFVFSATTTTTHPFVPFLCFFSPSLSYNYFVLVWRLFSCLQTSLRVRDFSMESSDENFDALRSYVLRQRYVSSLWHNECV